MQIITSKQNNEIKLVKKLLTMRKYREEFSQSIAIGEHLVEEFSRTSQLHCIFICQSKQDKYCKYINFAVNVKVIILDDLVYKTLEIDAPIFAIINIINNKNFDDSIYKSSVLALENIQDPNNLGAILRVAAAAGVKNVLLSSNSVDVYNPKVLRSAQGCITYLNIYTDVPLTEFIKNYQGSVNITTPHCDNSIYHKNLISAQMWVFGNEGSGVSPQLLALADNLVSIPMPGQIESMNIVTAVAVCLFEQVRQQFQSKV